MMRFRLWIEMTDAIHADTSNVSLQQNGNGFTYSFTLDGDEYTVFFQPKEASSATVRNVFGISFRGPNGYGLTGKNRAPSIYRQLFMAVKKFIETVRPDGIVFSGATPEQNVMYATFYRKILGPVFHFTKVDAATYLSQEALQKVSRFNPSIQQNIEQEKLGLKDFKARKIAMRQKTTSPVLPDVNQPPVQLQYPEPSWIPNNDPWADDPTSGDLPPLPATFPARTR